MDSFPVNCYLLGQVLLRQVEEKQDKLSPAHDFDMEREKAVDSKVGPFGLVSQPEPHQHEHQDGPERTELVRTLLRARTRLTRLKETKKQLEAPSSCYEAAVTKLSDHMTSCHTELELVGCRVKERIKQEEEKMVVAKWEMCLSDNLIDIIQPPTACLNDAEIVIDQNIFSAIESHVEVDTTEIRQLEGSEMAERVSTSHVKMVIIDSEERNEAPTDPAEDIPAETFPVPPVKVVFQDLERVEVTWVNSPSSFYVRRMDDWHMSENLRSQLEHLQTDETKQQTPVVKGQTVMVECRGTVTRARVDSMADCSATVTYLDIGGTGHHPLFQLTGLSGQLATIAGLAHHCTLTSISPPGTVWSSLATQALSQATLHTTCLMTVQHMASTTLPIMVSLYLQPGEGVARDHKCCLAEFLVYKGLADWSSEEMRTKAKSRYQKGFLKLAPARQGSEARVMVAHVEDPGCVFVQLVGAKGGYAKYLRTLMERMESVYSRRVQEDGLKVLVPRVGMACVAQHSADKKHYRVQVTGLLGEGRVEIQFVDFGTKEVTTEFPLLKILDQFLTLPVLATPVCLAGIVPVQRTGWEEEATQVIRDKTSLKELVMFVEEEKDGDDHCKVLLYERLPDRDVSINSWLVKEGHAFSITGKCTTLEYEKDNLVEVVNEDETGQNIRGLSGKAEKVACRVISVQSPSSLFVRQVLDEELFYQMNRELQAFYSSRPGKDVKLSFGSLCAASMGDKEGWSRAKVLRVKGSRVELKLLDAGRNVTLPAHSLRPLADKFRSRNLVEEVHLVNILPAGGTGKWTRVACETLEEMLEQSDMMVYVEIAGKSLSGTLPVKMYLKQMTGSDAEYVPVDDKLIHAGLAIPAVNRKTNSLECRKEIKQISDPSPIPVLNDQITSIQWLQPDPVTSQEFLAVPSHVDWEGNISICPQTPNLDTLRIIGNVLDSKFQGSLPRPVDRYWKQGQAAMARWDLDGRWYRALVLGVNYNECTVQFVDYGTVEECKVEDMRKDLFMTEIPIQCFLLQLENIHPVGGKWEQSVLDFLHSTVVDQTLTVSITSTPMDMDMTNTRNYVGKLTTKAGLDIGHLLVRNGYAKALGSN